ncbi:MAG: 2-C-methyl-D-erythritol 2,4-cyclodiphosphate synthase [Bacteroidota bacterium]|nr:2-C-methyl-D-erythritol 2,4-cyclodiphosphate synthase [Bacteroidota bacterium]
MFRIGFGFDTHALGEGLPFHLGGILIPYTHGPVAHSDGDVLIHAICDSLLGAAALRDIGYHFPDTSPEYKGIDSSILLKKTFQLLTESGFLISNIDTTLVLEKPHINPFIPQMIKKMAEILEIGEDQISIKAKTSEKLGFIGRGEGVSAYAVSLIYPA